MSKPLFLYDPTNAAHRTLHEWVLYGNLSWFGNAFVYAVQHGEAYVRLHRGVVLKLWWNEDTRLVEVEEGLL